MAGFFRAREAGWSFLLAVVGIAGIALALTIFQFWLFLRLPGNPRMEVRQLNISPGMSASKVARLLQSEGVIADYRWFYLLCRLKNVGHKLQAGEYAFLSLSTPEQILDQIVSGRVILQRVTLPEGSTVRDVAKAVAEKGLASEEEILRLARDSEVIRSLGLDVSSLEGYLFPETYFFPRSERGVSILKAMVRQFRRHLPPGWEDRADELGLSVHEVVIMASMVEKEAVVDAERPLIAAVFFNRLKRNMPLQSDPTAVYDLENFSGPILWDHLKRRSPYNTYQNRGLPIGPICNPGIKSLKAVLYPEKVPYLYFVSNNDGTHEFSETLAEHRKAVSRYREKRNALVQEGASAGGETDASSHGIGILEKK